MIQTSAGVLVGGQICLGLTADHRWERTGSGAELGGSSSRMGPTIADAEWEQSWRVTPGRAAEKGPEP